MADHYTDLVTATSILVAFLIAGLLGRIRREMDREAEDGRVRLAWADYLGFIALVLLATGGLLVPVVSSVVWSHPWLGIAALALWTAGVVMGLGYPFALAGHYNLSARGRPGARTEEFVPRGNPSRAEVCWLVLTAVLACGLAVWVILAGRLSAEMASDIIRTAGEVTP